MSTVKKTSISVAIVGARGYVGDELIKLLNQHPVFELELAVSRSKQGQLIDGYSKKELYYQDATDRKSVV